MPWTVVRGVYKKGTVEPLERVPHREGVEVLVLFPKRVEDGSGGNLAANKAGDDQGDA